MNESKDNGQLQNKHASSKPKESEKGDACTLVLFCARRLANRAEGKRGFLTGRPCRHRGLPPPPPPPLALEHHGYSSSYLVRSHDALELSFRSERSQLPGLALWAACAAASRNRKHRKYCPQDRKPTWEMSSPKRISLPPWEQRGFLQRREGSPNECTHQVRFSSVREPPTTEGRNKEELGKNCCVGCRIPVLALGTHSFDRGGSIDRSINRGSRPQTRARSRDREREVSH